MGLRALDYAAFQRLQNSDAYYRGRWPYLACAADMAAALKPSSALELGPYRRPLLLGSDLMDRSDRLSGGSVDVVWDARKTPWPIEDDRYDLFVALQVWEHLGPHQQEAFSEVKRIAKTAILSFPYNWQLENTEDCHHGITMKTIVEWTMEPTRVRVVSDPPTYQRAVCLYRFS